MLTTIKQINNVTFKTANKAIIVSMMGSGFYLYSRGGSTKSLNVSRILATDLLRGDGFVAITHDALTPAKRANEKPGGQKSTIARVDEEGTPDADLEAQDIVPTAMCSPVNA